MNRRAFIVGTLTIVVVPLDAGAQPAGKVYRVGYVTSGSRGQDVGFLRALEDGLKETITYFREKLGKE